MSATLQSYADIHYEIDIIRVRYDKKKKISDKALLLDALSDQTVGSS